MYSQYQWLTLVNTAIQEAEIMRITVQSQPGQSLRDPILKKPIKNKE
jgi:hypothetical protein